MASVDSWLTDIMHPHSEPDSPISSVANVILPETTVTKRMNFQKKMFLYTNLILLHRPYVNDPVVARNPSRPSYDICTFAAIIITDAAYRLEPKELIYHSKSPMIAYALVMALRIHIMNTTTSPTGDKLSSDKNYYRSISTLEKLPQCRNISSLLHDALVDLKDQYDNRFVLAQERVDEMRVIQNQIDQNTFIPPQDPFGASSSGKRKEISCTISSEATDDLPIRQYVPHDETVRPRKKTKTTRSQQPNTVDNKKEPKFKGQHVFSKNDVSGSQPPKNKIENDQLKQEDQVSALQMEQHLLQQQQLQVGLDQQQQHNQIPEMMQTGLSYAELIQTYTPQFQDLESSSTSPVDSPVYSVNNMNQEYSHTSYDLFSQQQILSDDPLMFLQQPQLGDLSAFFQFCPDFLNLPYAANNAAVIEDTTTNQLSERENMYHFSMTSNLGGVSIKPSDEEKFLPSSSTAQMSDSNFPLSDFPGQNF